MYRKKTRNKNYNKIDQNNLILDNKQKLIMK